MQTFEEIQTPKQVLHQRAIEDSAFKAGEEAAQAATRQLRAGLINIVQGDYPGYLKAETEEERETFKSLMVARFNRVVQAALEEL